MARFPVRVHDDCVLRTSTRKRFLLSASGAATAAAVGGAGIGLLGGTASARTPPSPEQDIRILTFLLGLQRIERGFYAEAVREGRLQGDFAEYLQQVGRDEDEHITVLEAELGSPPPQADLNLSVGDAFRNAAAFVQKAAALEDAVVAAHNGQVTNLTPARLQLVCSIVSVEARHAAWIRDLGGMPPAAGATDAPLDADAARDVLRSEGFLT
jgi:hypothetical protein